MRNTIALSVFLLVCIAAYYLYHVGDGQLRLIDEFHTLDRTLAIGTHGEWLAIYTENHVSFIKPPLQYWMSAVALDMGMPQLSALRLPSLIAALLLLPLVAILTEQLVRRSLFTVLVAPLILAGSERFWTSAMSALLDQGSALLATAALVGSFLALRNPKWWYLVAVLCGLSALQKAPVGLVYVLVVIVVSRFAPIEGSASRRTPLWNRHFVLSIVLAFLLMLIWPLIQTVRFGEIYWQVAIGQEMFDRLAPSGETFSLFHDEWAKGVFRGQTFFEVPCVLAILIGPYFIRRTEAYVLCAIFVLYVLATGLAGGHISDRYSIYLYPLMASMLAALLALLYERTRYAIPLAALLVIACLGPFKTPGNLRLDDSSQPLFIAFLQNIAGSLEPDEVFIRCRHGNGKKVRLYPGTISVYGSAGKPVWFFRNPGDMDRIRAQTEPGPLRGICSERDFDRLTRHLTGVEVVDEFGSYIHWRADPLAGG